MRILKLVPKYCRVDYAAQWRLRRIYAMDEKNELLRRLPKMDGLLELALADGRFAGWPRGAVADGLRSCLEEARQDILTGKAPDLGGEALLGRALALLKEQEALSQRPVINATGVLLHTNLGRSLLAPEAVEAAMAVAGGYSTLEFDCQSGKRGDRYLHVESLLRELLGVEAALVVNNNAAAVMLTLSSLAKGREVIVSRGELVEIGGAFRVPEVMEQSGCILREVGATNKTHPSDYERAIGENTAALLKVHTSNYRIVGFTGEVTIAELAALGREKGLPLLYDLGSGAMLPLSPYGIQNEPTVQEGLAAGVDVLCFSGDKLLGGPQAGVLVGKARYIEPMKKHPLLRALRVDKMTLAALEATLRLYRRPEEALSRIPLYRMLAQPVDVLEARAVRLLALLPGIAADVVESEAQIGAGSVPNETIPSRAVRLRPQGLGPEEICRRLLQRAEPVAARIHKDSVLLDMRTVQEEALERLAAAIVACTGEQAL